MYVTFDLPDGDAEFEVKRFAPASAFRWNEPPDPGEIELCEWGVWTPNDGETQGTISLSELAAMYAEIHRCAFETAIWRLECEAFEDVTQQMVDSYDERMT